MRRRWTSFHTQTTVKEALEIPNADRGRLFEAMAAYRDDLPAGYRIEHYGDGLWMITDAGRGQGRGLFFRRIETANGLELLVALLFYKKESARAPDRIIRSARKRMQQSSEQD